MIERNLSHIERLVRFVFGLVFAVWTLAQPSLTVIDWLVFSVALMLMLNGIFSRCFLWWMLRINTAKKQTLDCY